MYKLDRVSESRPYVERAIELYYEICPQSSKKIEDLKREDFDELVMFWSR